MSHPRFLSYQPPFARRPNSPLPLNNPARPAPQDPLAHAPAPIMLEEYIMLDDIVREAVGAQADPDVATNSASPAQLLTGASLMPLAFLIAASSARIAATSV